MPGYDQYDQNDQFSQISENFDNEYSATSSSRRPSSRTEYDDDYSALGLEMDIGIDGMNKKGKFGEYGNYGRGSFGQMDRERPLIQLDSDGDDLQHTLIAVGRTNGAGIGQTMEEVGQISVKKPSDELRRLLRQMEDEVQTSRSTSPIKRPNSLPALTPSTSNLELGEGSSRTAYSRYTATSVTSRVDRYTNEEETPGKMERGSGSRSREGNEGSSGLSGSGSKVRKANWREGRRIGYYPPERSISDQEENDKGGDGDEDEAEESPPTPPLRITNPYLYSRKVSGKLLC